MVDDRSATLFDEDGGPTPPLQANVGGRRLLGRLAVVTAVLPWVVAVGRALTGGWTASADNALLAIRGLDVLSVSHHPLLGAVSTVSSSTGIIVHHPGPLLFGIIAVPSWLLGTAAGIPLAIGTVNALCAGWIVLVAGRVGGLSARLVSAMAVALLGWTMTWPRMVEPWNPHSAMVPALLFFVACGALTLGEPRVALPAVVGGSLCLQAHIGYVYIVALVAMVTLGLRWLDRRMDPGAAPRWTVRNRVTPLVVLVLLWMQPILDLVVNGRASNVASMLRVAGSPPPTLPRGDAIRLVAAVIALPPWWLPGGFNDLTVLNPPPGMAAAAPALVVVVALLALIGWRGATRPVRAFGRFAAVLVPAAVVAMARVPVHPVFLFSPSHWRWLWVLGVFVAFVVGWALVSALAPRLRRDATMPVVTAALACVVVLALSVVSPDRLALVEHGPDDQREAIRSFVDDLPFNELSRCRRVLVDYEGGFGAPALIAPAVMLALRERDINFAPTADDAIAQLDRRPQGDEDCQMLVAETPGTGRPAGSLEGPLPVVVTLAGPGQ